jgi:hypothetical protein
MLRSIGMAAWDIDLLAEGDCIAAVMDRARSLDCYRSTRAAALPLVAALRQTSTGGLGRFRDRIEQSGPFQEASA